jgi:hypothetical protein
MEVGTLQTGVWKHMQASPPGADYQHAKTSSAEVKGYVAALDNVKPHQKKRKSHAVSVDLPYATWGVSTHEPNLTKRQTMMPREEGRR